MGILGREREHLIGDRADRELSDRQPPQRSGDCGNGKARKGRKVPALMETKADLTPLYAILQAKETDSDRSQANDAFDQGTFRPAIGQSLR